jgi:hypothetical protein
VRVVCISEDMFKKLKKLLGELSPLLVADIDIAEAARPAPTPSAVASVPQMVLSVMEPGKAYSRREILRLVEEKYSVKLSEGSLDGVLNRLVNSEKLKRVRRGVYQLA